MNKYLNGTHWLLVIIVLASSVAAAQTGYALWQTAKVNDFISNPSDFEQVPEHLKAQFAQAYNDVEQGQPAKALEILTVVSVTDDAELEAASYFNRGNIHLREAQALPPGDSAIISLVGLAKQDYRTALLIDSSLWDARLNLELALLMAPEEANVAKEYSKRKGSTSVIVKVVGFRVDLP